MVGACAAGGRRVGVMSLHVCMSVTGLTLSHARALSLSLSLSLSLEAGGRRVGVMSLNVCMSVTGLRNRYLPRDLALSAFVTAGAGCRV